jgi:hypothetical protein
LPFRLEERLPCGTARVAQANPDEMKIFVEQNAAVLAGLLLQVGIEDDLAAANESGGVGGITGGVPEVGAIADCDGIAVKEALVRHQLTIAAWILRRC